jgi:hypothetical protein
MSVLKPVITLLILRMPDDSRSPLTDSEPRGSGQAQAKLTQPFLQGQLPNFSHENAQVDLLDTLDHIDYDSA